MGQYYLVANMDKKEVLTINGQYPGKKLMEIALDKDIQSTILNLISGDWHNDHVYIVGDYAEQNCKNEVYFQSLRKWRDKFHVESSLFEYIEKTFTPKEGNSTDHGYRYIYNHQRKEYIDILHCPKCHGTTEWMQEYISPLVLLIAMGNGRGGGDYYNSDNDEYVGIWCDSIHKVDVLTEPNDELEYTEFHPDFYEDYDY